MRVMGAILRSIFCYPNFFAPYIYTPKVFCSVFVLSHIFHVLIVIHIRRALLYIHKHTQTVTQSIHFTIHTNTHIPLHSSQLHSGKTKSVKTTRKRKINILSEYD